VKVTDEGRQPFTSFISFELFTFLITVLHCNCIYCKLNVHIIIVVYRRFAGALQTLGVRDIILRNRQDIRNVSTGYLQRLEVQCEFRSH
jgi:hypothetical protein